MTTPIRVDAYEDRELNAHQRGGVAVLHLAQGMKPTTGELAQLLCMTRQGASKLMRNLERGGLPIALDDEGRWWCLSRSGYT